jgi:hypothetical protein
MTLGRKSIVYFLRLIFLIFLFLPSTNKKPRKDTSIVAMANPRKIETGKAEATMTAITRTKVTGFSTAYDFMTAKRSWTMGGTLRDENLAPVHITKKNIIRPISKQNCFYVLYKILPSHCTRSRMLNILLLTSFSNAAASQLNSRTELIFEPESKKHKVSILIFANHSEEFT